MAGEKSDQSLIKTPKQLVVVVVLGFVVPVLLVALVAYLVVTGSKTAGDNQSALDASAVAARIKPVAEVAIAGKGAMPPRGGATDLSDDELAGAIVHMANQSGGKLKEPAAPKGPAPEAERSGEQVVQAACIRCHGTGEGGAPRVGDKAAWSQRIAQGVDAVTKSAIRGHGSMPARGGLADLTDREVTRAILHMFGRAGAEGAAKEPAGK